jgi:methylenetetrahydrofolate dehydrogenase (NADP+)/methenyltetrahydrofolate cyclohydrolase
LRQLPAEVNQAEVLQLIARLNQDAAVHGVILQLPLPGNLDASILQCAITPVKDVEGVHPHNLGLLVYGAMLPAPCTALSAFELIRRARPKLYGQEAVIVGHSRIVGRPLAFMLLHELCTVTICHVATQDLAGHTRHADILVSAVGKANLIAGDMVKPGAIVIDIGINHLPVLDENAQPVLNENGKPKRKVVGDVVFDEVRERAEAITPVPGGVGPLTVNMLLRNLIYATEKQAGVR